MSGPTRRRVSERRGFWYGTAILLLRRPLHAAARVEYRGGEHLPATGGVVIAANHISQVDPLYVALFTYEHGRLARFLAKDSLFSVPALGPILTSMRHIPVYRGSAESGRAVEAAVRAARAGQCVVVYPEATITRDPDGWPMAGKTGAARIALTAGVPLIPLAQWGAQDVWSPYSRLPHLGRRHVVRLEAGPPVDLSGLGGQPLSAAHLRAATDRLMDRITTMVGDLRGQTAPPTRYDPRTHRPAEAAGEETR